MADQPMIPLPQLCPTCLSLVVHGARFAESDPWRALTVVVNLGLFQAATRDEKVWQRCSMTADDDGAGRDVRDLPLVLAEIGCLGCFKPKTRDWCIAVVRNQGLDALSLRTRTNPVDDHDHPGAALG